MEISEWKKEIQSEREMKDTFFSSQYHSPIPFEDLDHFKRLDYYPPDPDFRFELVLHEHVEKKILKTEDTQGNEREFLRWGEFCFKIADKDCSLHVYKSDPMEEHMFVPFRDETNGKQTNEAGRFLDLDNKQHLTPQGKWIFDFNKAYNPWCAYSDSYACPFVDQENWLKVPICAGEKKYSMR